MVKSYKGKEWNMDAIARKYETNIALGNSVNGYVQNGRGDLVKNGKIVKTREEQIKEWREKFLQQEAVAGLKPTVVEEKKEDKTAFTEPEPEVIVTKNKKVKISKKEEPKEEAPSVVYDEE